jgi:tetratricopeptide (TPR) repeat protein
MFAGQKVLTPYGESTVLDVSRGDEITVCEPNQWKLATSRPPTYYLNRKDVRPYFAVGDQISCAWGRGLVQEIRSDAVYVITLENWKLADGKSPTLYLQESALSKVLPKKDKKKKNTLEESLKKAIALKGDAGKLFSAGKYTEAREKYFESLTAMHAQKAEELSTRERAMVFEQTVPCHNNISLCSFNLNEFVQCIDFARNSLALISKLLDSIMLGSEIWKVLAMERGLTMEKLLEWKKKAHFNIGKASAKKDDHDTAITHLEEALTISNKYPTKAKDTAMIQALLASEKKKKAAALKREKNTWKKAFSESKKEYEEEEKEEKKSATKSTGNGVSQDTIKDIMNGKKVDLKKAGLLDLGEIAQEEAEDEDDVEDDGNSTNLVSAENSYAGWAAATGLLAFVGMGAYFFLRSRHSR